MGMSKTAKIIVAAGFLALIAFIVYSTMDLARVNCEVCMEFRGRTSCKPAFGVTKEEALRTATTIACSEIASGRDETIVCQGAQPKSLDCKE